MLEERLETDRSIIRNLLLAAQHWEQFRRVLQAQVQSLDFVEDIYLDPRWTEGRDDLFQLQAVTAGYMQRLKSIDYRISTDLIQETDILIQRITNLISIDEGYRSRDQNQSIRRLTWITFIFLPLVFTAGLFGMNVDLFRNQPSWRFYVYASLIIVFMIILGYAMIRSRRRAARIIRSLILRSIQRLANRLSKYGDSNSKGDVEGGAGEGVKSLSMESDQQTATILQWAASSGRTNVIRELLQDTSKGAKKFLSSSETGQALFMAIQNGHQQAATFLIETGDGLDYSDGDGANLLHCAAKAGQSDLIRQLLEKGLSLNAKDNDGRTPLDCAITANDEATINLLLRGGKELTRKETTNIQSLHFSARTGDMALLQELQRKGSSLEARDGKGQTVLFHAVKGKQHNIVKWLLDHKANIQAIDKEGLTALHVAASECDVKSSKILIDHGADINALSIHNLTPLLCIPHSEGVPVLRLLSGKGADIHATDKSKNGLMHKAAAQGDRASLLIRALQDLGGNIYVTGSEDNSPVHLAAEAGGKAVLKTLIPAFSALCETRNATGYTPLMMAARAGRADVMRYLLELGASQDVSDTAGTSLVDLTIRWGDFAVMQVLQDFGANFNNFSNITDNAHPIWQAIHDGQSASIERILDSGLSVNFANKGISLLQLAAEVDNSRIVRILLDRGAEVNKTDSYGWSALHSAAYSGSVEIVLLILQHGDKEIRDHQGWTPLHLALFYKHEEVVKILDPEGMAQDFVWSQVSHFKTAGTNVFTPLLSESIIEGVMEAPSPTGSKWSSTS